MAYQKLSPGTTYRKGVRHAVKTKIQEWGTDLHDNAEVEAAFHRLMAEIELSQHISKKAAISIRAHTVMNTLAELALAARRSDSHEAPGLLSTPGGGRE
ncbi:hypothetical protein [Streptomyces spiralis]|uniref:hypothetical protein n=1 Tax=Streptomyces spiralis TaxID=66376 RepID=UPI0036914F56